MLQYQPGKYKINTISRKNAEITFVINIIFTTITITIKFLSKLNHSRRNIYAYTLIKQLTECLCKPADPATKIKGPFVLYLNLNGFKVLEDARYMGYTCLEKFLFIPFAILLGRISQDRP